uniref:Sugar phosphate transporter domain-containing protein n=1 Tax=Calcidiscus leptoporus TaxID=127549 RepID=A0A7S0JFW7_9EUKA|mmetsp:Transcript_56467/g.129660  ORF Transcript_56467/g.129660 Transcript_56467/m.129660 type:complete len:156 (+) Transcript_56467:544-1011(+)
MPCFAHPPQVKHVLNRLPMSTWTRVYYNNAIALFFSPPFLVFGHEYARLSQGLHALTQPRPAAAVTLSCILGVGISFTGFGLRNLVTATTFTVLGVMNKVLTILFSMLLFAQSASMVSIVALLACISGGTMYQQAPPREGHDEERQAERERLVKS